VDALDKETCGEGLGVGLGHMCLTAVRR